MIPAVVVALVLLVKGLGIFDDYTFYMLLMNHEVRFGTNKTCREKMHHSK